MTEKEIIERKILLKRQLIEITEKEIDALLSGLSDNAASSVKRDTSLFAEVQEHGVNH